MVAKTGCSGDTLIRVRFLHLINGLSPMLVTLSGMEMLLSDSQEVNA